MMSLCALFCVVFPLDRAQQRRILLWNAFLSGLWSRSLISPFFVEAFKSFAQDRVPQRLLRFLLDTLVKGFFALFPRLKKCDTTSALWVGTASALEPMDAGSL